MSGREANHRQAGDASPDAQHEKWLAALNSKDGLTRERARAELVRHGRAAVPVLLRGVRTGSEQVRWEAVKALEAIADPAAGRDLCASLEDASRDVRWLAAKALIALGPAAVPDLLGALSRHPESVRLREGAHHVLKAQIRGGGPLPRLLAPVVESLESAAPEESVALAAQTTLAQMNRESA